MHYTLGKLRFADGRTTIGWEEELDAVRGARKAQLFGSHAGRVNEEKGWKSNAERRIIVRRKEQDNPDLLGCRLSQDGQGDDDTSMRIHIGPRARR